MSPVTISWYGKLPSHGDFLSRRVPGRFLTVWDDWQQRCIVQTRVQLDSTWQQTYLTSPLWRFLLCEGVIGARSFTGVVLPSMDKVGRCFPLTIFVELPQAFSPWTILAHGSEWFTAIELTALDALEKRQLRPEEFDAQLQGSASLLRHAEHSTQLSVDVPCGRLGFDADHWRIALDSNDQLSVVLSAPRLAAASRALRPLSLWWTEGSEQVAGSCLLVRSLPVPVQAIAMLDGAWSAAGWVSGDPFMARA